MGSTRGGPTYGGYVMNIITLKDMTEALEHKLGLNKQKAKKIAEFIMDVFGYETRIVDNILKTDERQIFYMLEAEGFMTTERETNRLCDGREWMTHYWELRNTAILYHTHHQPAKRTKRKIVPVIKKEPQSIYSSVTEDMWTMRKITNQKAIGHF
jgi:hypothetical protein